MEASSKQPSLKLRTPILVFSAFNIVLGFISIGLQVSNLIATLSYLTAALRVVIIQAYFS